MWKMLNDRTIAKSQSTRQKNTATEGIRTNVVTPSLTAILTGL